MKNKLIACLMMVLGAGCIVLLCIGTLSAIVLGFLGIVVFFGAVSEAMIDVAAFALFGVITVALASICCFTGLLFLLDCCLNRFPPAHPQLDKPLAALVLASVLVTAALFWSTQGEHFEAVCITADVLYVVFILLYFRIKRGKTHDPNRP